MYALGGCGSLPEKEVGSLEIRFANGVRAKNIFPDEPMDTAQYQVIGTSANDSFDVTVPVQSNTVIDGLLPEQYTVIVKALNENARPIGEGSAVVTVVIGQTTPVEVTVLEYTAIDGALDSTVDWQPDIISDPNFQSYVKNGAGTQTDLTYTVDAPNLTATCFQGLPVGFFTYVVKIYDGDPAGTGVLSTGYADILRIISDYTTAHYMYLTANQATGQINISVVNNIPDPLELVVDVEEGELMAYPGYQQTINVSAVGGIPSTFTWYQQGEQVAFDQDSFVVDGDNYIAGNTVFLDVLGWSNDGTRAGAAHWTIVKLDADPLTVDVRGTCDNGYGVGMTLYAELYEADGTTLIDQATSTTVQDGVTIFSEPFDLGPQLVEGDFHLFIWLDKNNNGLQDTTEPYQWYNGEGVNGPATPPATPPITIPHAVGVTFNLGAFGNYF